MISRMNFTETKREMVGARGFAFRSSRYSRSGCRPASPATRKRVPVGLRHSNPLVRYETLSRFIVAFRPFLDPGEYSPGSRNGRGSSSIHPPDHAPDRIEYFKISREGISRKAADLYRTGHSLSEISQALDIPCTTAREAVLDSGATLRPQGRWQNEFFRGAPPYGFVVIAGKLIEEPREQRIVQLIMSHWKSGKSLNAIAQSLNRQKVRPRRGKAWEHSTIRFIVKRNRSKY
jgi:hypothetical protein